jgi:hypothetical protein
MHEMTDASLVAALETAGLALIEEGIAASTPIAVASLAASCRPEDGRRDEVISRDDPQLVEKANSAWFKLVSEHGILDPNREFLLVIGGHERPLSSVPQWARVQLLDVWDIIGVGGATGVLGYDAGCPEFIMAPLKGDSVLRGTTYQDFVSILFVPTLRGLTFVRDYIERRVVSPRTDDDERTELRRWLEISERLNG